MPSACTNLAIRILSSVLPIFALKSFKGHITSITRVRMTLLLHLMTQMKANSIVINFWLFGALNHRHIVYTSQDPITKDVSTNLTAQLVLQTPLPLHKLVVVFAPISLAIKYFVFLVCTFTLTPNTKLPHAVPAIAFPQTPPDQASKNRPTLVLCFITLPICFNSTIQ